jgi:hypothetical protein
VVRLLSTYIHNKLRAPARHFNRRLVLLQAECLREAAPAVICLCCPLLLLRHIDDDIPDDAMCLCKVFHTDFHVLLCANRLRRLNPLNACLLALDTTDYVWPRMTHLQLGHRFRSREKVELQLGILRSCVFLGAKKIYGAFQMRLTDSKRPLNEASARLPRIL